MVVACWALPKCRPDLDTMPTLTRSVHLEGRVHSIGGCSQGPREASNHPGGWAVGRLAAAEWEVSSMQCVRREDEREGTPHANTEGGTW